MVGWHHRLDGHEFEQTMGDGDGQGSLLCCSPWGHKESNTTEQLNWTELSWINIQSPNIYYRVCYLKHMKKLISAVIWDDNSSEWNAHGENYNLSYGF